jgi:hypothetical protein
VRLTNPLLALVGLLAVGAVAVQLLTGGTTLSAAGFRIAVAIGVLVVLDRVGVPLVRAMVGPAKVEPEPEPDGADGSA